MVAIATAACGLWLVAGVGLASIGLFAAYELAFVLVPGVLAYRALGGRGRGALEQLAIGWPLGYLLEILAFLLASATGVPLALAMSYPMVAIGAALVVHRRAPSVAPSTATRAGRSAWAAAGLCAVVLAYVGAGYFGQTPLATGATAVGYEPDLLYDLSLAGEAKQRWPLGEPLVAGRPFGYHSFPYLDLAATSAVTGLELPLLLFRLHLPPMAALLVAQLVWAGGRFGNGRLVGVVAAAVALLLGELDLDPDRPWLFANYLGVSVWGPFNHGFVLGALFFVPAIVLLSELAGPLARRRAPRRRRWITLSLLIVGCAGAKGIALLPLLIGALALWLVWWALARRELNRRAAAALGAIACLLVVTYLVQYRGQARGTELAPLTTPTGMTAAPLLAGDGGAPAWLALAVGAFGALPAVLIGCALVLADRDSRRSPERAWLLALLLAGLAPLFLFSQPGDSHLWPAAYAGLAGSLLGAPGLTRLGRLQSERWGTRALVIGGAAWLGVVAALVSASKLGGPEISDARASVLSYASLASGLIALAVLWIWRAERARHVAAAVLSALCLTTALDAPLDVFPEYARRVIGEPRAELSAGLIDGLRWIRDHTPNDAVLAAASPQLVSEPAPRYAHNSAFSERRVLVEGWALTGNTDTIAERVQLNRAIFEESNPRALADAADDYGVTHLVVDKRTRGADPALARLAPLVFSNADVDVHAIRPADTPTP